jgi:predicted RNase H-like nuclease (RuvC/YqgF family)
MQYQFVNNETPDTDTDTDTESDSESSKGLNIRIGNTKNNRNRNSEMGANLLQQVLIQQNKVEKLQRKLFKIEKENEVEEVKSRYLKLDFNNLQVKVENCKEEIVIIKKKASDEIQLLMYTNFLGWGILLLCGVCQIL